MRDRKEEVLITQSTPPPTKYPEAHAFIHTNIYCSNAPGLYRTAILLGETLSEK